MFIEKFRGKLKFDKLNESIFMFISDAVYDYEVAHLKKDKKVIKLKS